MEQSKKTEIYETLKHNIVTQVLRPGTILNEGVLAKQYGVSRTPIREALLMLAVENMVNPLPRAGYLVTELTIRDVQESFHLRELLECEAARLAASRIDEQTVEYLSAREMGVPPYVTEMNRDFHLTIARTSGSMRLYRLIEQSLDEMERMLIRDPYMSEPPQTYSGHREIVEALRRRDAEGAKEAMSRHLLNAKMRVLERF
jgi:DNA-binding GntR family transcriptional regulator